jgi:hypothetical protein
VSAALVEAAVEPLGARPAFATPRTPSRASHGPAIGVLARAMGRPLMPWQQHVADVATEVLDDGSWAYRVVIVTVPRQSGKTTLLTPLFCERCMTRPDALTWHTAQTRQDARDSFIEASKLLARSPLRPPRVAVRRSNGSEGFTFPNGASWRVFAPTEDALHGKANELVAVDEAWAQRGTRGADLEQAILPTFTTTGGQLLIVSTAGDAESTWLRELVERGRAAVASGVDQGVALFEWALPAEFVPEVTAGLENRAVDEAGYERALTRVLDAHPAYGFPGSTMRLAALRTAADVMAPGEFLRAYANVWTLAAERVIPASAWDGCRLPGPWDRPTGDVAVGFDVALDGSSSSIVTTWDGVDDDGSPRRFVSVEDDRPGYRWVTAALVDLVERVRPVAVTYAGSGPVTSIADEAARAGVRLSPDRGLTARDYSTACQAALASIVSGSWAHLGGTVLDEATAGAGTKTLGDGWAFSRRESAGSIASLVAATAASWGLDHPDDKSLPAPVVVARRRPGVVGRRRPASRPA